MRLNYKILWFEDDADYVTEDIGPRVEKYLREELGFDPEIIHETSDADIDKLLSQKGGYDLIITDLNLTEKGDEVGQKIIDHVRKLKILTDVILYSASPQAIQEIREKNPGIERISFAAGRPALYDKVCDIIFLTIKKVQDVNNMRGLVIAEAIDLEMRVRAILIDHYRAHGDRGKIKKLKGEHTERIKINLEEIKKYDKKTIPEFIDEVLSFSDVNDSLLSLVNDLLDEINLKINGAKRNDPVHEKKKQFSELRRGLVNMKEELIHLRNDMAHAKEFKKDGESFLRSTRKGRKDIIFDDASCIEMRKNIFKHIQNIEEIGKHL